jgi:AcrR family transcriptional regulator
LAGIAEFLQRVATPDPSVLGKARDPDETTARILRGALEQFELIGIRRTTMEDVARRSGVGRATLYRRFPTKDALVDAVVLAEVVRYLEGNARARARGTTVEERMVEGTLFTMRFMREHTLLKRLLDTEPETILPSLTVDAGTLLAFITEQGAAMARAELYGADTPTPAQEQHLRNVVELHARLTISFILTPQTGIILDTTDDVRAYAHDYLLPMVTGRADGA